MLEARGGTLTRLDAESRRLIQLRLWRDASWAEIAAECGLPSQDAARMRYNRALDRLRELMPRDE